MSGAAGGEGDRIKTGMLHTCMQDACIMHGRPFHCGDWPFDAEHHQVPLTFRGVPVVLDKTQSPMTIVPFLVRGLAAEGERVSDLFRRAPLVRRSLN